VTILAQVATRVAQADIYTRKSPGSGETTQRGIDCFLDSVTRSTEQRVDVLALRIEQHRILNGWGKNPTFFETDYEERPSVCERRLRKHRHMEMPGTWPIGSHAKPADTLSKKPQSVCERATEGAESPQVLDRASQCYYGCAIKRAVGCHERVDEVQRAVDQLLKVDWAASNVLRN
jgi:hypothetical protein